MLRIPDQPPLSTLRDYLFEADYSNQRLNTEFGLEQGLRADLQNLQPLLERTSGDTLLALLARLFFVGWPVRAQLCQRHLRADIFQLCLDAGVFVREGEDVAPSVVITPFKDNSLYASDAPRLRPGNPDAVMGPSKVTGLFERAILRNHGRSLLDIGTGCGVLSVMAAAFSDRVIGTDINARAIEFARFNAALNGITNAQFIAGDALAPVKGRKFTHILANPPFFIAASKRLTYSDSPLELDGFVRKLVTEAPAYLEDNGIFQMICEWVQIEGEPWQDRLRSWTEKSECDVFILLGPVSKALDYSERRYQEAGGLYGKISEDLLSERLSYLREHRVEYVLSGVITMRKRAPANWFAVVDGKHIEAAGSAAVEEQLDCLTLLSDHDDGRWLNIKLRLSPQTEVTQSHNLGAEGWTLNSIFLHKPNSLFNDLKLDPGVLRAVEMFDGTRTLKEIAANVHEFLGGSYDETEARCLELAKRLVRSGYVLPLPLDTSASTAQ